MNRIERINNPNRLLLAWQAPDGKASRTRYIVGELFLREKNIIFRYLPDTDDFIKASAGGFVCYPAFRKIGQEYTQGVLESFLRRLPPRKRGDFDKYLEQWRLAPNVEISDFALLGHTGAKLPNDGFSLINPFDCDDPPHEFFIEVAGFRYYQENISIDAIAVGMEVVFITEPDNEHDSNAVIIEVLGKKIGYVNKVQSRAFSQWLKNCSIEAWIARKNGTGERPLIYIYGRVFPMTPNLSTLSSHLPEALA